MARIPEQEVWLTTDDGVTLEARALLPPAARHLGLLCHPHPVGDGGANRGTMDNKVVHGMMRVLRDRGAASIRFNFRSAGRSGGVHDEGRAEQFDVRSAIEWLRDAVPGGLDQRQLAFGYSFGSWVGLKVARHDPAFTWRVAVGPPLSVPGYDWDFLAGDPRPLTIVVGERDPYCSLADARKLLAGLSCCPTRLAVVDGADHFFIGQGHLLRRALEEVADEFLED